MKQPQCYGPIRIHDIHSERYGDTQRLRALVVTTEKDGQVRTHRVSIRSTWKDERVPMAEAMQEMARILEQYAEEMLH